MALTKMKRHRAEAFLGIILLFCIAAAPSGALAREPARAPLPYAGKKIMFIDSYHQGYAWSDGIEKGVRSVLGKKGIVLKVHRMDTKRNTEEAFMKKAALEAKSAIDVFDPDVIIAADDNASKHLIMPYYRDVATPVVFCGINWVADPYGYPYSNTTGMVERELTPQLVAYLERHAGAERIGYLSGDVFTGRKVFDAYKKYFFGDKLTPYYARTFSEFKTLFLKAQKENDIVLLNNNGGIGDWDHQQALRFFAEKTTVPTGTHNSWIAPYALISFAKVPEELGEWSAKTALRILDGTPPSFILLVENKKATLTVNMEIARCLGIHFDLDILKVARIIGQRKTGSTEKNGN